MELKMIKNKQSSRLRADFESLCDCGGRLSGTQSEAQAVELLKNLGSEVMGVKGTVEPVPYLGWQAVEGNFIGPDGVSYKVNPLVRTIPTPRNGLDAEVIDLGRGSPNDFDLNKDQISGRIVMVRHELMFASDTIHRGKKYRAAVEAGAAGFLIVGPVAGSMVSGSSGRKNERGIPAAGISPETAEKLAQTSSGFPRIQLNISTLETDQIANNLIFDLPGEKPGCVVLSAHIDGHDLAESAMDNATGMAVALEVARRLAPEANTWQRGLRLAFFNVEEWALTGSAHHVSGLTKEEKDLVALNVNLDSVAGGDGLAALTSEFPGIEPFLSGCAKEVGIELELFRPLQINSDHANFAVAGIPAFRLVSGFGDATAATSLVLTELDTRDYVKTDELDRAANFTEMVVRSALTADAQEVADWRST
jgi:Zn-dependent M28 family amino/carboxypeptidase